MSFEIVNCFLCFCFLIGVLAEDKVNGAHRIVGGTNANIDQFPYQVSLRFKGKHFCGGSIISDRYILTAAHCVQGVISPPYSNVAVFTGSSMSIGTGGQSHRIKRADVHDAYLGTESSSYRNDIAILTLMNNITFDANQQKIELPSRDVTYGSSATVTGWGIKKYPSSLTSPVLQKALMNVVPVSRCSIYLQFLRIYNEQVCAIQKKGVGACSGDSGGPLAVNNEVIGIASWVIPCGVGYPDVYTKVFAYKNWIKTIIEKDVE